MATKVIGRFAPKEVPNAPRALDSFPIKKDGNYDRLDLVASSITPTQLNSIRSEAASGAIGRLYELYLKIVSTEPRIGGIVGSMQDALSGLPVKTSPAKGTTARERAIAQDYAAVVEEARRAIDEQAFVADLFDAFTYGLAALQMAWTTERYPQNRFIAVPAGQPRPLSLSAMEWEAQFDHDKYGEMKIRTTKEPNGIFLSDLDPRRLIVVSDGYANGYWDCKGAIRRVLGWWMFKMYVQLWWAEYVESYGQPMRVGRYSAESTANERAALRRFLSSIGRNKWGMFPIGTEVQFIESTLNASGSNLTYENVIKMADNQFAVALQGQTGITTDSSQGSRSKLEVLAEIRSDILGGIVKSIRRGYDQFADATLSINYGDDYIRRLRPHTAPLLPKPEDLATKISSYKVLSESGYPVPVTEISEQTGVPVAEAGEMVLLGGSVQEFRGFEANGVQDRRESDDNSQQATVSEGEEA